MGRKYEHGNFYCEDCNKVFDKAEIYELYDHTRCLYCINCGSKVTPVRWCDHVIGNTFVSTGMMTGNVVIPEGVTRIANNAFRNSYITSVKIPGSLNFIPSNCFENCLDLETVNISYGTEEVSWYAFKGCTKLKTINLPDSVKEIGWFAFEGCESLESITIPEGVEKICNRTFCECYNLKTIELPSSLRKIEELAFEGCENLEKVIIKEGLEEIGPMPSVVVEK